MAFNVSDFISRNPAGFGRSSHFEFDIALPGFLKEKGYNADQIIKFTTIAANIPGVSLDTTSVRRSGTTYKEFFPINVTYSDLSVTLLSDAKASNLNMIKDWLEKIFPVGAVDSQYNLRVPYRNEYIAPTATLKHFNPQGDVIIEYNFYDVFPERIGPVSLNWAAFNDTASINVEFKYKYYSQFRPAIPESKSSSTPSPIGNPQPALNNRLPRTSIA